MTILQIYTDGACEPNPGPGAWGAHIIQPNGQEISLTGYEAKSTNQRMELMAPIAALESERCHYKGSIIVYSDSQYVIRGITSWIKTWKHNGWRNSKKQAVANRELWERLDATTNSKVRWQWVRGHDGNEGNERADFLARQRLFSEIGDDPEKFRQAVRGFSRHADFDPTPYMENSP